MKNAQVMAILCLAPWRGCIRTVLLAGEAPTNKLLPQGAGGEEGAEHSSQIFISNFHYVAFKNQRS